MHEKPFELETSEDITKVFRNEEMEDEEMEFMDGTWKKEINTWEELVGNNLLNQEAVIEGAVHSIRNMGDVAFIILRRREGLFQTVYENEMANVSIHELKEAMTIRVKGILHEEERAPHGRELRIRHIDILSTPAEPLPMAIDKWKLNTSLEAKLNYRPISLR
ncbi:MAG TPA: OB-fold nucleic acid binding domain-containing protein, partial [Blautia wexlerae]|nr:OB-fold nucleic acid binding domain-containing protein [Blautia wexlerae]